MMRCPYITTLHDLILQLLSYNDYHLRCRDSADLKKGPCGGQLMHAVAKDANNQMHPLVVAVVEAECKDSWVLFLENLIDAIGRPEEHGWTFIYDRQKGLVESFNLLMPRVDHRFCEARVPILRRSSKWYSLLQKQNDIPSNPTVQENSSGSGHGGGELQLHLEKAKTKEKGLQ